MPTSTFNLTSRAVNITETLVLDLGATPYENAWSVRDGNPLDGLTYTLGAVVHSVVDGRNLYSVNLNITGVCSKVVYGDPNWAVSTQNVIRAAYGIGLGAYTDFYIVINIDQPDITIPAQTCIFTVGTAITPVQFTATGGVSGPFTFSPGTTLPSGLSLSSSGLLTGTPTSLSSIDYRIEATDSVGNFAYLLQRINVSGAAQGSITFHWPDLSGTVGVPYSKTITASGTTVSNYNFSIPSGALPDGLTYTSTPTKLIISGTPTKIESKSVPITAQTIETYPVIKTANFLISIAATSISAIPDTFNLANRAAETELTVLANDVGGTGSVHYITNTTGMLGSARVAGGRLYYTPRSQDAAYTDKFTYAITDGLGTVKVAEVTVNVAAKSAETDVVEYSISNASLAVTKNTPRTIEAGNQEVLLVNLFGVSVCSGYFGCPGIWYIISVGSASQGSASLTYKTPSDPLSDVTFKYTPNTDYTGSDSVLFTVKDPNGIQRTATLNITITAAGALTITPANDVTLFVDDIYEGPLFTIQGGVYPYRICELTLTGIQFWVDPNTRLGPPPGYSQNSIVYILGGTNTPANVVSPVNLYIDNFIDRPLDGLTNPNPPSRKIYFPASHYPRGGYAYATLKIVDGSTVPGESLTATAAIKFTIYGSDGSAPDPDTDPGDPTVPSPPPYSAVIQGTLRLDTSDGVFAARTVYLYNYTTGDKVAQTTSDGATGAWSFTQVAPGDYFVVGAAQGDDLNIPRDFDALGVITVV
jgi:hypothetical protein